MVVMVLLLLRALLPPFPISILVSIWGLMQIDYLKDLAHALDHLCGTGDGGDAAFEAVDGEFG